MKRQNVTTTEKNNIMGVTLDHHQPMYDQESFVSQAQQLWL